MFTGGDASTQQRDAESQGVGTSFAVYKNDLSPGLAYSRSGVIGSELSVIIADGFISWTNNNGEFDYLYDTRLYYALNGQSDNQGSVNKDIFIGLNQVVNGYSARRGIGLCSVTVTFDTW